MEHDLTHFEWLIIEDAIRLLKRLEKLLEKHVPITVDSLRFTAQQSSISDAMANLFDDKVTYFFPLATMSDGTIQLFPAAQYTLSGDIATPAVTPTLVDMTIPGLTAPVPAGTSVWSIPATNAVETVNLTASNINDASGAALVYTNGTTATPITFTAAEAAEPLTVASISFVAQQ